MVKPIKGFTKKSRCYSFRGLSWLREGENDRIRQQMRRLETRRAAQLRARKPTG